MDTDTGHLERGSARTLYEQVIDRLRGHLSTLAVGDQAPTEAELTQRFSVGRSTIRKAMQHLTDEGVLIRQRGKGTFVARAAPKIIHSIDRVAAFMDTFRAHGEEVETRLLDFGWDTTNAPLETFVGWKRPILRYLRLYTSRGIPHAVAQIYLPYDIGREVSSADVDNTPTYSLLKNKLGITPVSSEYLVSCQPAPPPVSKSLALSHSTPLLVLERVTRDMGGRPVEMTRHYLRPDVYQLFVTVRNA